MSGPMALSRSTRTTSFIKFPVNFFYKWTRTSFHRVSSITSPSILLGMPQCCASDSSESDQSQYFQGEILNFIKGKLVHIALYPGASIFTYGIYVIILLNFFNKKHFLHNFYSFSSCLIFCFFLFFSREHIERCC